MSMKSESTGMGTAYFSDGHTEVITDFEISKDYKDVWFTTESGRCFVYEEILVEADGYCCPDFRFCELHINRDGDDEFGPVRITEYLVTDSIEKIRLSMPD